MSVNDFAEAQKTHYTVFPKVKKRKLNPELSSVPFIKLLNGQESLNMVEKRWELYHQLHTQFHSQVDTVLQGIETDLHSEILQIISTNSTKKYSKDFNCLFLLGSDSTTTLAVPKDDLEKMNVIIDLTPKESPNVRMMLRRSMFKLLTAGENQADNLGRKIQHPDDEELEPDLSSLGIAYDLSLVQNFDKVFKKNLKLIFNFKDVDSFNFQTLDDFILLLKSALKYEKVEICLVFNINTNLSNIEKNLKQSTIRILKRNFHKIDLSRNKGHKYANRIFQSFLNTVDGKLNLSPHFVEFTLTKMANNTNQNLQLLVKILDYALMSYFFQNPFSVFIDPTNVGYLNDQYLSQLIKCPTFMNFIEGMVREHAPSGEIMSLLENRDSTLEEFFAEFLVRENPINGHLQMIITVLEEKLGIHNYDLIKLYHHLLSGKLETFLEGWPQCQAYYDMLRFEPIDIVFQELFTLDNSNELFSQSLFPCMRSNLEDNLLNCERMLPPAKVTEEAHSLFESKLNKLMDPPVCQMFKLYREASSLINLYDFYAAFKETLPKGQILQCLRDAFNSNELDLESKNTEKFKDLLTSGDDDKTIDKVALVWFIQAISEFQNIGILKTQSNKSYDVIEKCIWRGL